VLVFKAASGLIFGFRSNIIIYGRPYIKISEGGSDSA
jgi:hypothetical protein